jgi:polar amino acid transport system permease protein
VTALLQTRSTYIWAAVFIAALVILAPVNATIWGLNPWLVRVALAGAFTLNVYLVTFVSFRAQIIIAWLELLALFFVFFYSFNLSYEFIWSRLPFLIGTELNRGFLMGAALTLFICFVAITASTILALAAALMRLSANGIAVGISTFYISFFRGTPLLLQIMLIYLGLPQIGIILSPIPSAIIALSLCYGAYMAEIFRAGIQSIPVGQPEAARSMGMKEGQIMRLVILPQAMQLIIPPTGNQFIAMLKDSSLVSILGAWDLMYVARTHGRSEFKYIEMLITAAIIYWAMSVVFELIQARIEKRMGKGVRVN